MSLKDIQKLAIEGIAKLPFETLREAIKTFLNTIEELTKKITDLRDENQQLKDEVARLKGEKGKPAIKPETNEKEKDPTHKPKDRAKGAKRTKLDKIAITKTQTIPIDRAKLPLDAKNKGTRSVVIQDLVVTPENTRFIIERFYSASTRQSYESELPEAYRGHEFGPGIRAMALTLHYQCRITQKILHPLLCGVGVQISEGQIGEILLASSNQVFHDEKEAARCAGIEKQGHQHIDDTGARLNGKNVFTIVTTNDFCCSFTTSMSKDRRSAIRALNGGFELKYVINETALNYMRDKISNRNLIRALANLGCGKLYIESEFEKEILQSPLCVGAKNIWKKYIQEGCAIGAYHAGFMGPQASVLICDDAPQFKGILEYLGLCWVHEGRHYKKLMPQNPYFQKVLDEFLNSFWDFYRALKKYRKAPDVLEKTAPESMVRSIVFAYD